MRTVGAVTLVGLAVVIAAVGVRPVRAQQQPVSCDAQLFKNQDAGSMTAEYRAAFLKSIEKATFDQMKSEAGAGLGIVVGGIPLGANGDYNAFSERRDQELQSIKFDETTAQAMNYVRNSFDGPGAKAYNDCLRAQAASADGLTMWLEQPTPGNVTVGIRWREADAPVARLKIGTDIVLTNSAQSLSNFMTKWKNNQEFRFTFTRTNHSEDDVRLDLTILSKSKSIVIFPAKPRVFPAIASACPDLGGDWHLKSFNGHPTASLQNSAKLGTLQLDQQGCALLGSVDSADGDGTPAHPPTVDHSISTASSFSKVPILVNRRSGCAVNMRGQFWATIVAPTATPPTTEITYELTGSDGTCGIARDHHEVRVFSRTGR